MDPTVAATPTAMPPMPNTLPNLKEQVRVRGSEGWRDGGEWDGRGEGGSVERREGE